MTKFAAFSLLLIVLVVSSIYKVNSAPNPQLVFRRSDLPVQVTGNIKSGFLAEFLPEEVGPYVISVEYNNVPVGGTPFTGMIYNLVLHT